SVVEGGNREVALDAGRHEVVVGSRQVVQRDAGVLGDLTQRTAALSEFGVTEVGDGIDGSQLRLEVAGSIGDQKESAGRRCGADGNAPLDVVAELPERTLGPTRGLVEGLRAGDGALDAAVEIALEVELDDQFL